MPVGDVRRRPAQGRATCGSRARTPTRRRTTRGCCRLAGQPARLVGARATSTSSSTCSAPTRRCGPPRRRRRPRPKDVVWRDEAPDGKLDLLLSLDFRMTQHDDLLRRRAAGGDLVREARPEHHRHAPVHPLVQPGDRPAVADPHRLGRLPGDRGGVLRARRDAPRRPQGRGRRAAAARHPRRDGQPARRRRATGRPASASRCPGKTMPQAGRRRARLRRGRRQDDGARPAAGHAGHDHQGRHLRRRARGRLPARARTARCAAAPADGRPSLGRDVDACEAILALSGTTNGHLATQGFRTLEKRTGTADGRPRRRARGQADHLRRHPGAPVPVITSPEWSGSETGGRRYSPFTINVERLKPWHTLTGRQHFYLDHDWMTELGERLPVFRPPLNMSALFGEPRDRRATGELGRDGPLPDPAQQVVDPLGVPGQPVHARRCPAAARRSG